MCHALLFPQCAPEGTSSRDQSHDHYDERRSTSMPISSLSSMRSSHERRTHGAGSRGRTDVADTACMTGLSSPGDPEQTPLSPQAAEALTRDLVRLDVLQHREGVRTFSEPAEGSPAARDTTEQPERAYAHDQAHGCIRAALDHLVAWRQLLFKAGIMPMYAHMSLLRTAHEAALLAEWLMDPAIDDDTRRARGIAAQFEGYEERRKFEESIGGPRIPLQGKSASGRIADLMSVAGRLGLTEDKP